MREEDDHDEVQRCDDQQRHGLNVGLRTDDLAALGEVVDGNIAGNGGLLQKHDEFICQRGQNVFECLRNDDAEHSLWEIQAQRPACLVLTRVYGHDAAANDLGDIGAGVDAEGQHGNGRAVACGGENDEEHDEDLDHGRRAANHGQVDPAQKVGNVQKYAPRAGAHRLARLIMGGTDDGDNGSDQDTEQNGSQRDLNGVPKTLYNVFPAILGDKAGDKIGCGLLEPV